MMRQLVLGAVIGFGLAVLIVAALDSGSAPGPAPAASTAPAVDGGGVGAPVMIRLDKALHPGLRLEPGLRRRVPGFDAGE